MEFTNSHTLRKFEQYNYLFEPFISGKQLDISYRKINAWHEQGLIPYQTETGKWRSFSFYEACWVRFIDLLREIGIGIPTLQILRNKLLKVPDLKEIFNNLDLTGKKTDGKEEEQIAVLLSMLENISHEEYCKLFITTTFGLALSACIDTRINTYLLIDLQGNFEIDNTTNVKNNDNQQAVTNFKKKPHVSIFLNGIIVDLLVLKNNHQNKFFQCILTQEENELIRIARNYKSKNGLTVNMIKHGIEHTAYVDFLEPKENKDPAVDLVELFLKNDYSEIVVADKAVTLKTITREPTPILNV